MEQLHEYKYKVALKKVVDAFRREEGDSIKEKDLSTAHTSKKSQAEKKTTSQTKREEERQPVEISTERREEPQPSTSRQEESAGPDASLKRPANVGIGASFSKQSKTANGYETIQIQEGRENDDLGFWIIHLDPETSWEFWDRIKEAHEKQLISEDVYKIKFRFGGNTETDVIFVFLQIDCLLEKKAENREKITSLGMQSLEWMQFKRQKCCFPNKPYIYYKHSGSNTMIYTLSYE